MSFLTDSITHSLLNAKNAYPPSRQTERTRAISLDYYINFEQLFHCSFSLELIRFNRIKRD